MRGFEPVPNARQLEVMTSMGFTLADEVEHALDCVWHGHGVTVKMRAHEATSLANVVAEVAQMARQQGREEAQQAVRAALGLRG